MVKNMERILDIELTPKEKERAEKLRKEHNTQGFFYWFNINLANDITSESRNLTKMMEKHLTEYWKTAWQTEPELAKIREKLVSTADRRL